MKTDHSLRSLTLALPTFRSATALTALAALAVVLAPNAALAVSVPINGTGYNVDGLADANTTDPATTTTHLNGTTFGLDGQFAFFETGFKGTGTDGSTVTMTPGITTGRFTSLYDPNTTFVIQPAAGSNVLEIAAGGAAGIFTLSTPARYSTLSFLATGFNGDQPFNFTLDYSDGTTTTGTGTAPDNFDGSPVALYAKGRVSADGTIQLNDTDPRIYQIAAAAIDSTRLLASISLTATGDAQGDIHATNIAFFGFSGTNVVPEPSTWALLSLGAVGLGLTLRGRRRPARLA